MHANLAAERVRRGLSPKALGGIVGVSESTVHRWETGETSPKGPQLIFLAQFYGCDPAYLLEETDRERR